MKYFLTVLLVFVLTAVSTPVKAADKSAQPPAAVEVGNKVCPVTGEKIENEPGMEPATVEYKGKIYNLCCSMCEKDFKKNPELYSKVADDEVAKASK